jgi:hypothetical protein
MARLWRNSPDTPQGKYLVKRRDGTVPEWQWFVMGSRDPNAPAGLRAYADEAERNGYDPAYVADIRTLANDFEKDLNRRGPGDPDAPRHRIDDPATIAEMGKGRGA